MNQLEKAKIFLAVNDFLHQHHDLLGKKQALLVLIDQNIINDDETVGEYLERLRKMIQ